MLSNTKIIEKNDFAEFSSEVNFITSFNIGSETVGAAQYSLEGLVGEITTSKELELIIAKDTVYESSYTLSIS